MKPGTDLHHHLMRVLPFLTYANRDNMELIINHFNPVLNFTQFDCGHTGEEEARLEAWVALCVGIERNILGNTMKDELVRLAKPFMAELFPGSLQSDQIPEGNISLH